MVIVSRTAEWLFKLSLKQVAENAFVRVYLSDHGSGGLIVESIDGSRIIVRPRLLDGDDQ